MRNSKAIRMLSVLSMGAAMYGESFEQLNEPFDEDNYPKPKKFRIMPTEYEERLYKNKQRLRQGQKQFWYGEHFVWARNQENTDRKTKRRGWL